MNLNRRNFIKLGTASTAALGIGFNITSCTSSIQSDKFTPNAWLTIFPDNRVVIKITRTEVGQGVITSIPKIIAEELNLDWNSITTELAEANTKYGVMRTSGSRTIRELWMPLRLAAASAKEMLEEAASLTWNTPLENVYSEKGHIYNRSDESSLSYGELAVLASTLDIPKAPKLKDSNNFSIVGKDINNLNTASQVTGQSAYGIDKELPNLLHAAIKHSPSFGSSLENVEIPDKLPSSIVKVLTFEASVVVVAKSYWQAQTFLNQLSINWSQGSYSELQQKNIETDFSKALESTGTLVDKVGDEDFEQVSISADYTNAFQAHVPMEPMNCTVSISENGCEVWVPTQHPIKALNAAKNTYYDKIGKWTSKILGKLGLPDKVQVYPTLCGGGFGRRLDQDYVVEAVRIAKQLDAPVKLVWSREEDVKNDFYRPYSTHRLSASIPNKEITNWKHHSVAAESGRVNGGAIYYSYDIPNRSLYFTQVDHKIPIGSWRSVSLSNHVFATESFIDEIAQKLNTSELDLRLRLTQKNFRAHNAIKRLEQLMARSGHIRSNASNIGYAYAKSFGSYIAVAIELRKTEKTLIISKIYCVADCGIVIDPNTTRAQLEGGIVFGLNAAAKHEITIENGGVKQSNFDDYPLLRINEMPELDIEIIASDQEPGGVGEIAVPLVAPALANAIYKVTGVRQRKTPLNLELS